MPKTKRTLLTLITAISLAGLAACATSTTASADACADLVSPRPRVDRHAYRRRRIGRGLR